MQKQKVIIEIFKDGKNSQMNLKGTKGMPRYEIIGILKVAIMHVENDILLSQKNKKADK